MNDLSGEIVKVIKRELGLYNPEIYNQQDLTEDLGIGSLEKARLIFSLDQRFRINSDSNISGIRTVGDCIEYVKNEMKKAG